MFTEHWLVFVQCWELQPVLSALLTIRHTFEMLGEGTGAVSLMPLIDMALGVYFDMPSFDGIGIEAYKPL